METIVALALADVPDDPQDQAFVLLECLNLLIRDGQFAPHPRTTESANPRNQRWIARPTGDTSAAGIHPNLSMFALEARAVDNSL